MWLMITSGCVGCQSTSDDHKSYGRSVLSAVTSGGLDSFLDLSIYNASIDHTRSALKMSIQNEVDKANLKIDTSLSNLADRSVFKSDPADSNSDYYLEERCIDMIILKMYLDGALSRVDEASLAQLIKTGRSCVIAKAKNVCIQSKADKDQCAQQEKNDVKQFDTSIMSAQENMQRERLKTKFKLAKYFTKIETELIKTGLNISDIIFKDVVIENDFLDKAIRGYEMGILFSHKEDSFIIEVNLSDLNGSLTLTKLRWIGKK
jgi:hypothetical protein